MATKIHTEKNIPLPKNVCIFRLAFRSRNCFGKTVEKRSSFVPPMASSHTLPRLPLVDRWKWRYEVFRWDVQGGNENNNMNNFGSGKRRERQLNRRRKSWINCLAYYVRDIIMKTTVVHVILLSRISWFYRPTALKRSHRTVR